MDQLKNIHSGDNLESYRQIMDPPCDDAIKDLFESKSFEEYRATLQNMVTNDSLNWTTLDPALKKFLNSNLHPEFTSEDFLMFRRAYEVWKRDGMKFIYILFFRSLPYTYMAEKPANVLRMTKLLKEHPDRRIMETAQFIFDVMEEEWWKPEKSGKLTALKIRMLHSTIRYMLLNHPSDEKWNMEWGLPISQEDLIATNQVFSLEFIKGMEIMGHPLSEEEQAAWYHTWKVIGKLMGIQDELLYDKIEDAWSLQKAIYNHLFNSKDNTSGIILGEALITTLSTLLLSEKLVLHMMRDMIKDEDHPDLFYRIFQPTYGEKYPVIFKKVPLDSHHKELHEADIHNDHHQELVEFHDRIKKTRNTDGSASGKKHLIDIHLDKIFSVLKKHQPKRSKYIDRGKFKKEAMHAVSGIILGLLSQYFRKHKLTNGKPTQFRIPHDLQENWSLKH